jgi:hypothetical protein
MKSQILTFIRMDSFDVGNLVAVEVYLEDPALDALTQLKKAVTEWVETTQEGIEEWDNSCEDFNIGDLLTARTNELDPILIKHGICGIETKYELTRDEIVPYDTILAEPKEEFLA